MPDHRHAKGQNAPVSVHGRVCACTHPAARHPNPALTTPAAILPLCKGRTMTTITPLEPHMIHAAGMADRLESDAMEDARLAQSIRDHGQQVPILVRPDASRAGHYQIVYGRRRTLACIDLGITVNAIICPMDDAALLMAQGQENAARRNLSFAEKANFARQLADTGHDRPFICAALSCATTDLSRMVQVTSRVPLALLETIGAAPGVGRDRWLHFAGLLSQDVITAGDLTALVALCNATNSDARFQFACDTVQRLLGQRRAARKTVRTKVLITDDGVILGQAHYVTLRTDIHFAARQVDLRFATARTHGFEDWLIAHLPRLHRDWLKDAL
jgi:ParB family transcriptional regulator, chromosome partitioning protein